ncbi:hypothetical protein DL96DRAFT_1597916 [Flagelloscypha sp. PMI_526]|nr:hypothetical protein DL96DRAFT_1597916 [Flagelloscypha sp. PMI_526]
MVRKSASQNSEVKPALPEHSIAYFEPVLTEYKKTSFESMKTAIFPSYFHGVSLCLLRLPYTSKPFVGKCQQNGVNPPGCPNPNCPVVCGTSGSMVHFYPKLLSITFEDTSRRLTSLLAPSSSKYKQVEKLVAKAAGSEDYSSLSPLLKDLREIVDQFEDQLEGECGGVDHDSCSWESDMKEFMLTFP